MSAPIGDMDQEQGAPFVPDDDAVPAETSKSSVFPDDNNVMYVASDTAKEVDAEQGESLLGQDKAKKAREGGSRKAKRRKDINSGESNLGQLLQDNLAAVCLGVAFSTLLVVVCIVYATGGFSESKPHHHTAPHPDASAAVYKHTGPIASHSKSGPTPPAAPPVSPSGTDHTLHMPALTPDPMAPSTKQNSLPLPSVASLKSRKMVVLDDLQLDADSGSKDHIEKLRAKTETHKVLQDSYAGYVLVNHLSGAHMFYWLSEARNGNKSAPVIVWLMGGPGAPSCVYMFQAMGPVDVNYGSQGEFVLRENLNTWNEKYAMLYLDQPVGTGFSWTRDASGFASTDEQAAGHIATAVPTILHMYGKQKAPLYIFGVSYGGKMAPLVAETLLLVAEKDKARAVNMQGVGIGNGWTDPLSVVRSYSFHFHARGYTDSAVADEVKKLEAEVALLLSSGNTCGAMKYLDDTGEILQKIQKASGIVNWYDLREAFTPKKYFEPVTAALYYINHIRKLLPVGTRNYPLDNGGMNFTVYNHLKCAIGRSSKPQVDGLLKRGVRVLVYQGEDDGMIPLASTRAWIKSLSEHPAIELQQEHQKPWRIGQDVVGYWRADKKHLLTEVLILHAGHLSEKDQPRVAKAMVQKWIDEAK